MVLAKLSETMLGHCALEGSGLDRRRNGYFFLLGGKLLSLNAFQDIMHYLFEGKLWKNAIREIWLGIEFSVGFKIYNSYINMLKLLCSRDLKS